MIIAAMLIFKGLKNMELGLSTLNSYLIVLMVGATIWMAIYIFARTLKGRSLDALDLPAVQLDAGVHGLGFRLQSRLQRHRQCGRALRRRARRAAQRQPGATAPLPMIVMVTFGVALIAGLWFIGKEVIATVGTNLTEMHPASGFSAELAAAGVTMGASALGIPVSSTHILIGAVLGIGLVNHQANWDLMKPIALAWVITLPAAAGLSALTYLVLSKIF